MAEELKQIMKKLDSIQLELEYIKENIADVDLVMTEDDVLSIEEAEEDLKHKRTKRLN